MKKSLVVLVSVALSGASLVCGGIDYKNKSLDEMKKIVAGAHIRAFSVDDLFAKPLDPDGLRVWHETINHVSNYVSLNSKGMFGKIDKGLTNILNHILQANFELVKYIKMAQRDIYNKSIIEDCANRFGSIKSEMADVEQQIQGLVFKNQSKKNAQDLLFNVAYTIESTAITAENHIYKYLVR